MQASSKNEERPTSTFDTSKHAEQTHPSFTMAGWLQSHLTRKVAMKF